ncbi:glutamate decarboxylase [Salinispora tropica]|uniref:glutamate decarboxylase n=1 Tax=Salinispora tropica TaxID=168695 RepID=UPI00048D19D4|nr:glutamate decarboxylase [Salinispora tropica]
MSNTRRPVDSAEADVVEVNPLFARPGESTELARFSIPDCESLPETAYQIVHDEVALDGNARLNLATFVGTWMDSHAEKLYADTFDKNLIDKDEYKATDAIEERCRIILADLWHAPEPRNTIGASTIGSSEACMLGGLALKRRWQHARRSVGKSSERPNLVMSSAVQVCWKKFCSYWDVEARIVPISEERKVLDGHDLRSYVDENTIGVVAVFGVTYTGMYEPVERIAAALDEIQASKGLDIPIHVDGATGAFVAPFIQPHITWDFRISRVASINVSSHKYGLVYPGLGWIVWRDQAALPEDLRFRVAYLGGETPTVGLSFTRPGAQVLLQYYLFLRLGRDGYQRVHQATQDVAQYLSREIAKMPQFELWSDGSDLPVLTWHLRKGRSYNWNQYHLSDRLRMKGWQVPTYPMPDDLTHLTVQRIVVRGGLSRDLAGALVADLHAEVGFLESLTAPIEALGERPGFHH